MGSFRVRDRSCNKNSVTPAYRATLLNKSLNLFLAVEDGCVVLNNTPGAGIEFDEKYLASHGPSTKPKKMLATVYGRAEDAGLLG
jgi:hypothetical protein